jgi:tetratricopeptide (TPR) repeat protein
LVTGHTIPTSDLVPGSYRLVLKATAEGDPTPAFSTLTLRVVPQETTVDGWTAYGPVQAATESADDLKRGLATEAFGRKAEAEGFYASELKTDPGQLRALVRLVALLSSEGKTAELARLSDAPLLASAVPPETLLAIAGAVRDRGDLKKAIRMVTAQLDLQAPSAPMYELLASLYDTAGDAGKASDARMQAKKFKPSGVAPTQSR